MRRSLNRRTAVILFSGLVSIAVMFALDPIEQDPGYHDFADQRLLFGIPHFADVVTNLLFVIVGILGLRFLHRDAHRRKAFAHRGELPAFYVFFGGVLLTGIGSGWYHLAPDNPTLVWDRLPMTLAFMGIFSAFISERMSVRWGRALLVPLLLAGLGSVLWWAWTESLGRGDLRWYALVQYYPLLAIVLMLTLLPSRYSHGRHYWIVLGWYAGAKVGEQLDGQILLATGLVTGHNLKHILAAAGAWWVLRMLARRQCRAASTEDGPKDCMPWCVQTPNEM